MNEPYVLIPRAGQMRGEGEWFAVGEVPYGLRERLAVGVSDLAHCLQTAYFPVCEAPDRPDGVNKCVGCDKPVTTTETQRVDYHYEPRCPECGPAPDKKPWTWRDAVLRAIKSKKEDKT